MYEPAKILNNYLIKILCKSLLRESCHSMSQNFQYYWLISISNKIIRYDVAELHRQKNQKISHLIYLFGQIIILMPKNKWDEECIIFA